MNIDKEQFNTWAKAPSETEEGKCQNAVSRIKEAIESEFGNRVSIYLQGSYKNRTNVKLDSDVDIVVCHESYFFPDLTFLTEPDKQIYSNNFIASNYSFHQFKNDIQKTLETEFGENYIDRKNKCIRVLENGYRVNADVVPCFVHNRMKTPILVGEKGIEFISDKGDRVYSFPKQHHENGIDKNNLTEGNYKSTVRILKNIRNDMLEKQILAEDDMPSFLLESLIWNTPPLLFDSADHCHNIRRVVSKIWNDMKNTQKANTYSEISDLKWLFKGNAMKHKQAEDFMLKTWRYIGFN